MRKGIQKVFLEPFPWLTYSRTMLRVCIPKNNTKIQMNDIKRKALFIKMKNCLSKSNQINDAKHEGFHFC